MESKKGALPIPYIVALVLGIVIIAVLGYYVFVMGGKIPDFFTKGECYDYEFRFCSEWHKASSSFASDSAPSTSTPSGCTEPTDTRCKVLLAI